MFRITRGQHVQHIRFPVPVIGIRDLDDLPDDDPRPAGADPSAPVTAPAVSADTDAPRGEA